MPLREWIILEWSGVGMWQPRTWSRRRGGGDWLGRLDRPGPGYRPPEWPDCRRLRLRQEQLPTRVDLLRGCDLRFNVLLLFVVNTRKKRWEFRKKLPSLFLFVSSFWPTGGLPRFPTLLWCLPHIYLVPRVVKTPGFVHSTKSAMLLYRDRSNTNEETISIFRFSC